MSARKLLRRLREVGAINETHEEAIRRELLLTRITGKFKR